MLALSRNVDEEILLDIPASTEPTRVSVKVLKTKGKLATLGIDAPRRVRISRPDMKKGEESR
jgi:sRNA-binding carbon storage regulator CsrA